jgi:hypothetical protein
MNEFSSNYSNFISHIKNVFPDNTFFENLLNESETDQLNRVKKLNDSLSTTTLFNYFYKNKIKLFSHKEKNTTAVSESMFGSEITLKKIFNNQEESVKMLFWIDLKYLLLSYNKYLLTIDPNDKQAQERVQKLSTPYVHEPTPTINPKEGLNKILKTENLNEPTNNMINDIFSTFEKTINQPGSNPFANIMQISQIIGDKYKSNIENGEVNLDDLLANMTGLPGMENMGGLISSLTKQMQPTPESTEKVIIDENFSTAIVPKGDQKEDSSNINVGELLKTMDSFGSLGSLMGGGLPDDGNMNKLMDVFSKLSNTSDPSQLNEIMENDLGIDMNKFTDEMTKTLNKNN